MRNRAARDECPAPTGGVCGAEPQALARFLFFCLADFDFPLFGLFVGFFAFFLVRFVFGHFLQFGFVVFAFELFYDPSHEPVMRFRGRRLGFSHCAPRERRRTEQREG
jgi:hypothetical protein